LLNLTAVSLRTLQTGINGVQRVYLRYCALSVKINNFFNPFIFSDLIKNTRLKKVA